MKFYRYLPAIVRLRDALASGFRPDQPYPEIPFTPSGASSELAGNAVAYGFRRVGAPIIDYVAYFLRWEVSTNGGPWEVLEDDEWQPRPDDLRLETAFPIIDAGIVTHSHFRVSVYSDSLHETLVFQADSTVALTAWTVRRQPIFERIFFMLERDATIQQMLIRGLPVLQDADHGDPLFLVYLAYLVGGSDRFPADLSTFRQREFVKQLVDFWKIKGTFQSWRKMALLRNLGTIMIRELYKRDLHEIGDYSAVRDTDHPLKSARIDVMVCDTQCESFAEFDVSDPGPYSGTNISVGEAIRLIEVELNDLRPVHVLVRRLLRTENAEDEFPVLGESIAGSVNRGAVADDFPLLEDTLEIVSSCALTCETLCQLCNELVMNPYALDLGVWKYFDYSTGWPVPPERAAFYASKGGGFVLGAAPDNYYESDFDDSSYAEGKSRFTQANGFAPHTEFVIRGFVTLNWVTGIVVEITFLYDDWGELYWNEHLLTPAIVSSTSKQATEFPFDPAYNQFVGRLEIVVPEAAMRLGKNVVAARFADHLDAPTLADVDIRVSIQNSAQSDKQKLPPVTVTF